jgi:membrane associated rhomboid family serine protease
VLPIKDHNPTRSFPTVTVLLIVLNVVVFLAQWLLGDRFTYTFAMIPANVLHNPLDENVVRFPSGVMVTSGLPVWTTIISSMFLHGGLMHLGGNMLYLWIFGNNTEDTLGHVRFLLFYLICGLAAAGLHLLLGPNSRIPTLGASGAIAGVLGAYIHLFPHARITTVVFIVIFWTLTELPAVVVLGFWFVMQLYNTLISTAATLGGAAETGGVAFGAHVGGFVAGWLLIRLLVPRNPWRDPYSRRPRYFDDHWS